MPPLSWTGRSTFFYPRISYGDPATVIDFVNPAHIVDPPTELSVQGQNFSLNGFMETLFIRDEVRITLLFPQLFSSEVEDLRDLWQGWSKRGRQFALTLDRNATCAGQYEFDVYNTYFSRAELLSNPFAPKRRVISDTVYLYELTVRQGALEQ